MLVISYNPGYQNIMKGLKASTRQRFIGLNLDYPDEPNEVAIVCQESGIDREIAERLVKLGNDLRRLKDLALEESASTRLLVYTAMMIRDGLGERQACLSCLAEPLTDDTETLVAIRRLIEAHFE